ncbi:MAG: hypothetical protein ACRYF4_07300 [Janthinobacterium lividum]
MITSAVSLCIGVAFETQTLQSQSMPNNELDVLATVLRAQAKRLGERPLLIATKTFDTGPMTVLAVPPTPIQKAAHQVELPYLLPPATRLAEARELAAAYNQGLLLAARPVSDHAVFSFPHRLLNDSLVEQFEALYPGGNVYSKDLEKKRRAVSSRYRLFFDGSTTLWRVSRVAYAAGGALAVVGLRSSGGGFYSESWAVLERSGNMWDSLNWGSSVVTFA